MHISPHPFITLVGPTASGKTALALELAQHIDGEIVCADSRTIYRGMDIGTAKPTLAERALVPHHLLDVIDPGETLSAAAFKELAVAAIRDIAQRGKVPFLVGGSGLYIDAVVFDYQFPAPADAVVRAQYEAMDDASLVELLAAEDPTAFVTIDLANRRRVIRALETVGQGRSRRSEPATHTLMVGLSLNKEIAQGRIRKRVEKMLEEGFLDEVKWLGETYGLESSAWSVIGYRAMKEVVWGHKSVADGVEDFVRGDLNLYKKQQTWFKRNPAIHWLDRPALAEPLVREFLGG